MNEELYFVEGYDYTFRTDEVISCLKRRMFEKLKNVPYFGNELSLDDVVSKRNLDMEFIAELIGKNKVSTPKRERGRSILTARDSLYLMDVPALGDSLCDAVDLKYIFNINADEACILISDGYVGVRDVEDSKRDILKEEDVMLLYDTVFPEDISLDEICCEVPYIKQSILEIYRNDINRVYEFLSLPVQLELSRKIKEGDQKAKERLVNSNLKFVISIAKEYKYSSVPLEDLVQAGNTGLLIAAEKFEDRGNKFISYAVWEVRNQIINTIKEQIGVFRIPRNRIYEYNKIKRIVQKLEQEVGGSINLLDYKERILAELGSELPLTIDELLIDLWNDLPPCHSLYRIEVEDDYKISQKKTDKELYDNILKEDIENVLSMLTERQQNVIKLYFGLNDGEELDLTDISRRLGLTRERVRQIKENALRKLLHPSISNYLKPYLEEIKTIIA